MKILDCVEYSTSRKEDLKKAFDLIKRMNDCVPTLAIVCTSSDPASKAYVNSKKKWSEELGVNCLIVEMDENTTDYKFIGKIRELNRDSDVHGVIIQLPIGSNLSGDLVLDQARRIISKNKDVDGLTHENVSMMYLNDSEAMIPCTPSGIIDILDYNNIELDGKNVVIINRSELVGKPLSILMTRRNATVTLCHSKTKNISDITKKADIIVTAVGKKGFITGDMVSDGALILDIGINREGKKLYGDVDLETLKDRDVTTTLTPSGTALCTLTALFQNLLFGLENQIYDKD